MSIQSPQLDMDAGHFGHVKKFMSSSYDDVTFEDSPGYGHRSFRIQVKMKAISTVWGN